MIIPDFLKLTYTMLYEAYPDGICESHYWVILYLLYDYMADENLALVMTYFIDKSVEIIMNDIYKVYHMKFDSGLVEEIKNRLDKYGFEKWKEVD